jgi:hypothetical protein
MKTKSHPSLIKFVETQFLFQKGHFHKYMTQYKYINICEDVIRTYMG